MALFLAVGRELATSSRSRGQGQGSAPRTRGFTLIELMIAAAIVAVLAALAYPAYTSYVRKGHRAAAQSYLMDLAQKQVQYLVDSRAYAPTAAALGATAPTDVSARYDITVVVTAGPPPTYLLTAAPKSGSAQAGDVILTINQAGQKTPSEIW